MNARYRPLKTILLVCGGMAIVAACWWWDFPPIPDAHPQEIAEPLAGSNARCDVYSLGGFIDRQYLWRIDAPAETIAKIRQSLSLEKAEMIPERFWKMTPFYWPRTLTADMVPWRSRMFDVIDGGGPDGDHYFLLHDTRTNRAYVWFVSNF